MTAYLKQDEKTAFSKKSTKEATSVLAIVFLIALCGALSSNLAFADKDARPFSATFIAVPTGINTIAGEGNATHLGQMDIEFSREFTSLPSPSNPCVTFNYLIVTITAANNDEVWMNYADGELCVDFTNFPVITFNGDVDLVGTGGTGRFSGSTGDYQLLWNGEITASGVINYGEISGVIGY